MSRSELVDLCLELAFLQRRQLVEQRLDKDGIRSSSKQLETGGENPQIKHKLVTSLLDNLEEGSQDGGHKHNSQQVRLDHVHNEKLGRLLVEAKLLL